MKEKTKENLPLTRDESFIFASKTPDAKAVIDTESTRNARFPSEK